MRISSSIDIASTPEVVFGWLARPEKAVAWMTSVTKTQMLREEPGMVGSTFRETVEDGGGAMEMFGTVTGFDPPRSISFHLSSKVNELDVTYCVEAIASGARVSEDAMVRWKFPVSLYAAFFGHKMKQGVLAQLEGEFASLKALCEGEVSHAAR